MRPAWPDRRRQGPRERNAVANLGTCQGQPRASAPRALAPPGRCPAARTRPRHWRYCAGNAARSAMNLPAPKTTTFSIARFNISVKSGPIRWPINSPRNPRVLVGQPLLAVLFHRDPASRECGQPRVAVLLSNPKDRFGRPCRLQKRQSGVNEKCQPPIFGLTLYYSNNARR